MSTFPLQVVILDTGKKEQLGIGVVNKNYVDTYMPGWSGNSLGYHTGDGKIWHNSVEYPEDTQGIENNNHYFMSLSIHTKFTNV